MSGACIVQKCNTYVKSYKTELIGMQQDIGTFIESNAGQCDCLTNLFDWSSKMKREEATDLILEAKKCKGVTWSEIAEVVGGHKVWVTSAMLGQNSMSKEEAAKAAEFLGLGSEVAECLTEFPLKGALDSDVPVDPLIYRLHEITQVYGTTMKAIIHEMFGDGIMSAIDFELDIKKKEDPKGDRVVVTYNGKFLPYKKW